MTSFLPLFYSHQETEIAGEKEPLVLCRVLKMCAFLLALLACSAERLLWGKARADTVM